jgi:zinc protease
VVPKVTNEPKPGIYCFHKAGKNITQGRVTMEELGIDFRHPDAFAFRLAGYILGGGGLGTRLAKKVRSDLGLAYDVHSEVNAYITYRGNVRVVFQSKSESCAQAAKACLDEIARMQRELVTEQELEDAKRFFIDGFPGLFFSDADATVSSFASAEMMKIPADYYQTYREKIQAVTREDVKRVANELMHPDKFVIVVVGNIPAIKAGNAEAKLADLGRPIEDVPLSDPVTLERPAK